MFYSNRSLDIIPPQTFLTIRNNFYRRQICVNFMALQQMHKVQPISRYNIGFSQTLKSLDLMSYNNAMEKPIISKEDTKLKNAENHKKAESNRRRRINYQFDILRTCLPNLLKKNKASILEETIQRVNELTNTVSELKTTYRNGKVECVFPGEADKSSVEFCPGQGGRELVKVMFSCEDKRRLMSDVAKAVKSVKGKMVKAEMVTMGRRTMCVLWVKGIDSNQELQSLRRDVEAVTERPNASRAFNRPRLMQ